MIKVADVRVKVQSGGWITKNLVAFTGIPEPRVSFTSEL